jgi:hypothetical protein
MPFAKETPQDDLGEKAHYRTAALPSKVEREYSCFQED